MYIGSVCSQICTHWFFMLKLMSNLHRVYTSSLIYYAYMCFGTTFTYASSMLSALLIVHSNTMYKMQLKHLLHNCNFGLLYCICMCIVNV